MTAVWFTLLLDHTLHHVDDIHDVLSVMRVCRTWRDAAKRALATPALRQRLRFTGCFGLYVILAEPLEQRALAARQFRFTVTPTRMTLCGAPFRMAWAAHDMDAATLCAFEHFSGAPCVGRMSHCAHGCIGRVDKGEDNVFSNWRSVHVEEHVGADAAMPLHAYADDDVVWNCTVEAPAGFRPSSPEITSGFCARGSVRAEDLRAGLVFRPGQRFVAAIASPTPLLPRTLHDVAWVEAAAEWHTVAGAASALPTATATAAAAAAAAAPGDAAVMQRRRQRVKMIACGEDHFSDDVCVAVRVRETVSVRSGDDIVLSHRTEFDIVAWSWAGDVVPDACPLPEYDEVPGHPGSKDYLNKKKKRPRALLLIDDVEAQEYTVT